MRVCGIDEAGRGALAGPLVAAAIILPCSVDKLRRVAKTPIRDGKTLSKIQRRHIYRTLKRLGVEMHTEVISTRKINNRGIQRANREAIRNLIKRVESDRYIVDGKIRLGRIRGKTSKIQTKIDADATIPEVILAGIVAKVERDNIMHQLHDQFSIYHWNSNAGYGTRKHIDAIALHGTTRYHRSIFVTTALTSLIAQGFDGVEAAGADGGGDTEYDADEGRES